MRRGGSISTKEAEAEILIHNWLVWAHERGGAWPGVTPFRRMYHVGGDKAHSVYLSDEEGLLIDKCVSEYRREDERSARIMIVYYQKGSVHRAAKVLKIDKNTIIPIASAGANWVYDLYQNRLRFGQEN